MRFAHQLKIIAILMIVSPVSFAFGLLQTEDTIDFYAGPILGTSIATPLYHAINPASGDTHSASAGKNKLLAGGVIGIQTLWPDCLYFAAQINAAYNSLKTTIRNSTNTAAIQNHIVGIKNNFQYGIDGRFGISINETIPYVILGAKAGKWQMVLGNNTATSNRGIPANSNFIVSKKKAGPVVGLGVLFPILCNVNLNFEYNYTWFGKINTYLTDSVTGFQWLHEEKIRQNSILVGLNWLF